MVEDQGLDASEGPINENLLTAWADPSNNDVTRYDFYQSKDSGRCLNSTVKLKIANSVDAGDATDSPKSKSEISGARVTVVANFKWKLAKDGENFVKPTEIEFGV